MCSFILDPVVILASSSLLRFLLLFSSGNFALGAPFLRAAIALRTADVGSIKIAAGLGGDGGAMPSLSTPSRPPLEPGPHSVRRPLGPPPAKREAALLGPMAVANGEGDHERTTGEGC
jgi:hypothetical protein